MTDDELVVEKARGRMVGMVSVIAVTLYTAFYLTSYFALKDSEGTGNERLLSAAHDQKMLFILAGFFFAIGVLLSGGIISHLLLSARSRSALVPKVATYITLAGPAIYAIAYPIFTLAIIAAGKKFADSPQQTLAVANELTQSGSVKFGRSLEEFARLLVAIAWVMTGVYTMRVGLLTRLVGFVAVGIGALFLFAPTFSAFIQIFWIGAVAIQLLGDSAQTPPAWKLGRPVPWSEVAAMGRSISEDPKDFNKSGQ